MLHILHQAENELPGLLKDESAWKSLFVDYHPPFVERLWRDWGEYRLYLHRIHPCEHGQALFHPHPWPSAIRILNGVYEMDIGFGTGNKAPPVAATIVLATGSEYEMVHKDGWHSVRPIHTPSMSFMVTGKLWGRSSPKSDKPLCPLTEIQKKELFEFFCNEYNK